VKRLFDFVAASLALLLLALPLLALAWLIRRKLGSGRAPLHSGFFWCRV
jgi:lipopolysaccharide/colanic/teichoic acid biosynthesis glycosyltransferase